MPPLVCPRNGVWEHARAQKLDGWNRMYSAKNHSCNKPNLITPTRLDSFNYFWVGTIQIVNICFLIKCQLLLLLLLLWLLLNGLSTFSASKRHLPDLALVTFEWRVISMELLRSFLRRHFGGWPVVASRNVGCFLRLTIHWRCLKPFRFIIKKSRYKPNNYSSFI